MKSDFKEKDQLSGSMRLSFRLQNSDCLENRETFFKLSFSSIHTLFLWQASPFPPTWKHRVLIILNVKVRFQQLQSFSFIRRTNRRTLGLATHSFVSIPSL